MGGQNEQQSEQSPSYERSDVPARTLVRWGIIFGAAILLIHGATVGLFWLFEDRPEIAPGEEEVVDPLPFGGNQPPPGAPRLQISIADSLVRLIARDEFLLSTYGTGPPADSVVRIPVAKAMEVLLERGLPVREEPPPFIPGRARFAESGYMLTTDTVPPPANYFGYDTTVAATSAEFHVPGHGPGEFHPRIQPPLGEGILQVDPEPVEQPVEIPTEEPGAREIEQ